MNAAEVGCRRTLADRTNTTLLLVRSPSYVGEPTAIFFLLQRVWTTKLAYRVVVDSFPSSAAAVSSVDLVDHFEERDDDVIFERWRYPRWIDHRSYVLSGTAVPPPPLPTVTFGGDNDVRAVENRTVASSAAEALLWSVGVEWTAAKVGQLEHVFDVTGEHEVRLTVTGRTPAGVGPPETVDVGVRFPVIERPAATRGRAILLHGSPAFAGYEVQFLVVVPNNVRALTFAFGDGTKPEVILSFSVH